MIGSNENSQDQLRNSEIRYRRLFEAARDGILLVDPETCLITDANPYMAELLGYTREEFIGKELWQIGLLKNAAASRRAFRELQQTGYTRYENLPLQSRLGKRREVEFVSNVYTENGQNVIQCNIRDITERKRAERAKLKVGRRFRFLCESMPHKLFTAKPSGELDYMNQYWTEFTGLSFEQIEACGWESLIHPDDREESVRRWQHSIDTGKPYQMEHRLKGADGVYRWHMSRAEAMSDLKGSVIFWIGSNIDIDGQKSAEQELQKHVLKEQSARAEAEHANASKDEFLATVSHELRTPLATILGWVSLLRSGKLNKSEAIRGLDVIERCAKTQTYLIEDILDISRIVSGKMRLDSQPVILVSLIESAVDLMSYSAAIKDIQIRTNLDEKTCFIWGDKERLVQVVNNLLSNAIKFTPQGGCIDVRLECSNTDATITVTDTGVGITTDLLPFIFDRFRQSDDAGTRKYKGLGLGLSIARNVIEMHGGSILAGSQGAGKGSSFIITLPLMKTAKTLTDDVEIPQLDKNQALHPSGVRGLRVEIIDDDPDSVELARAILERGGAEVTSADSATKGLALFEKWKPDVLISDLALPERDGYWLIAQVRALDQLRGHRTPVAALTAYVGADDRARALLAGFDRYMRKPVDPSELFAVVANLVQSQDQ